MNRLRIIDLHQICGAGTLITPDGGGGGPFVVIKDRFCCCVRLAAVVRRDDDDGTGLVAIDRTGLMDVEEELFNSLLL